MNESRVARRERERTEPVMVQNGLVFRLEGDRYVNRVRRGDMPSLFHYGPPLSDVMTSWVGANAVAEFQIGGTPPRPGRKGRIDRRRFNRERPDFRATPDAFGWYWMLSGAARAHSRRLERDRRAHVAECNK